MGALELRATRAGMIARNLANADTPNYKARDIDFASALADATPAKRIAMSQTAEGHIRPRGASAAMADAGYRVPGQPSVDGNTVDTQREMAAFAENQLGFQAGFTILQGRIRGMMSALRGE